MATQCRSSKCTAERKGFRRELDSWRHKLIHCVGFESVLEGIYGPRLLQDLNIFDECEPEAVDDWSVDANCAFCNLKLEKLNDHSSAVVVPGSPTSAETPSPQGLSISEKLQCQADRFLHAIFRKKEFPQSCDSSVPLVAQELMRKMIRRFALEYASKSQAHEGLNGLSDNSEHLPQQPDPDGPLDLTVSRASQALQQVDGVLDLSKKNPPSENASIQQKVSGSLGPNEEDQPRLGKKDDSKAPKAWKVTVLEKILSSFCSRHRLLLYHILIDMQEDYDNSVTLRDVQRRQFKAEPLCCHADKKLLNDSPTLALNDCSVTAGTCCRSCRFSTCTIPPICVCLKNIHSHSCQNIAVACVGQVTCSNTTVCCTHSRIPPCQYQQNGDHAYICCTRGATQNNCNSHNGCRGSRSPSPPPLSPKPVDTEGNMTVKTSIFHIQDCKTLNMAPPPLLPHRTEDEDPAWHPNAPIHAGSPECHTVVTSHTQADKENDQCGSLIGDLMERVTEKLRSIQPSEREQSLASQTSKTRDDTHLTEIITTVLHNSSDKDYNLNDLLQQHVATGSPQTRSRRRLDTLESMSKSPDLRRQSLQIKRDFARLSPSSPFRRKMESERKRCPKTIKPSTHSAVEQPENRLVKRESETVNTVLLKDSSGNLTTQNDEVQNNQEAQPHDDVLTELPSPNERTEVQATDCHLAKTKRCEEGILTVQVGRSRRNIVPPQRFSSYVTEPRKMYFAACFSESIFVKHSPEDSTSTALCSTEETVHPCHTCDKQPFITEDRKPSCDVPQNIALPKDDILCKNETICEHENDERSPRKRKSPQNSISPSKRSKHSLDTVSTSPTETVPNSTTTESVQHAIESQRGLKYDSPIKLMFVSSETGEDGVKYTLKAATSGSNSQDMFDPCMESSWAGSVIKKQVQDSVIETAPGRPEGSPTEVVTPITLLPSCSNSESENLESIQIANQTSPVKRRPGRPKKLGPHIVKSVKRPIGRPPKPKTTDSVSTGKTGPSAVDHRATEISRKDDGNKNLKITIVYGRSRRVRRVVSEDFGHLSAHKNDCEVSNGGKYSKLCSEKKTSNDQITKEQLKDLHFVMPVEDKKCTVSSSCNIKCQRQSDVALSRKPGRPPKVKISGISVTVSSESPRQRRIHMKRDTKDSHLLRRTLFVEFQPSKEQKTINNPTDIHKDALDAPEKCSQNPRWSLKPVRHSVRERKPSIHLLHSVATARSCALVRRSRKLLLNKASSEASHPTGSKHEDPPNNALSKKTKNVSSMQDIARFSTVSVNPIFSLNDGFRWWPTSALPETLNQELSRRIRLMSNTWVSDVLEANKAELKASPKPKTYNRLNGTAKKSAVKKLFDKNYDIEKLCTWFMQTTETQSLAIAKKASVKNPKEVFHYNPSRPNYKVNTCPSPQAERLRKHVKKFAKVVPKSPTMHKQAQEMLHRARMSQAKRKLFKTKPFKLSNDIGQRLSRSRGTWIIYRTTLLKARLKFQTRSRKTIHDKAYKIFSGQMGTMTSGAHTIELLKEMHSFVNKTRVTKVRSALKPSLKYPGVVRTSRKMLWNLKENRIGCKAWSPESLNDCRVFLKKINSPNTKSTTEECNNCTVMCSDGSSEQENERNRDIVVRGALKSPVLSSPKCTGRRKRIEQKSYSTSPSPPAKMLRQSRSSRGVLGARWCDFVLGSLK